MSDAAPDAPLVVVAPHRGCERCGRKIRRHADGRAPVIARWQRRQALCAAGYVAGTGRNGEAARDEAAETAPRRSIASRSAS